MKKEMTFGLSIIPILALLIAAASSIFIWEAGMHIPLLVGVLAAALVAKVCGWRWDEIEKMMVNGVSRALPAVFILLIIGIIVGTWIASGVIPTMIYYGLSIIEPSLFIPLVALITGIVSITLRQSGLLSWRLERGWDLLRDLLRVQSFRERTSVINYRRCPIRQTSLRLWLKQICSAISSICFGIRFLHLSLHLYYIGS